MLFFLAFVMFAAYIASDNIFSVESALKGASYQVTESEYSSLAGAYSIFNVYLLMLIFGGLILDKTGIRFTGIMSCILMIAGIAMLTWGIFSLRDRIAAGVEIPTVNFLGDTLRTPILWAVTGMGIYGVGAEIAGITVTKAIAKWFIGYEMALAMGLQLSLARLGTGLAYGVSPIVAKMVSGNLGIVVLIGLIMLAVGLGVFLVYAIYDKKLDRQIRDSGQQNTAQDSSDEEFHLKDTLEVIKNPAFWLIAILCLLFYAAVNPFLKYSTGMMVNKFGMSQELAGLFPMILPMGCIVLTPLFGNVYDRKGHGADLMILGAVLIVLVHAIFAIPSLTSNVIAIILMITLGIGFAMLPSAMWPSIAKIMPAKLLGTTMALTFYIQNIGFIFVPKAIGAIKTASGDNYSYVSIFFAGLGIVALLLALSVKLLDKKKHYGLQEANIKK